mmetsp:Transcript_39097/g.81814  ORF Transcript_39097/g.81814 Transcript_39097/m.81814 type:complete len:505 (-) Transcript_39097:275-1789(-)
MVPLLINTPNIAIYRSSQRRNAIIAETWWEKENLIATSNNNSNPEALTKATGIMEINNDDIPSLRGWFLKEKRDKFKRHQSIIPGTSSNRRWFTIERIPNGNNISDEPSEELALCYYKRSSSDKEQRCGWLFLNDVLSLTQDVPNRWITIEHPTRILRLQSPTPAQHRVWFSTLSKCCKHVQKEVASPSSTSISGDMRPSLPYFDDSVRKAKKNSLKDAEEPPMSTTRDELQFLREITGGGKKDEAPEAEAEAQEGQCKNLGMSMENAIECMDEKSSHADSLENKLKNGKDMGQLSNFQAKGRSENPNRPEGLFLMEKDNAEFNNESPEYNGPLSSSINGELRTTIRKDYGGEEENEIAPILVSKAVKDISTKAEIATSSDTRIVAKKTPRESEEKTEVEPLSYDGRGFEETNGDVYGHSRSFRGNDSASRIASADGRFEMNKFGMGLSDVDDHGLNRKDLHTSHSFSSSRQISRSSSYQLHFGNEDEGDIGADSDFLDDDWDE